MTIVFREGLSYDESASLTKLYLMADAVHGSSEAVLEVRASDLLRLTKALMREHKVKP
jgi:hypothetical protein